jgi:predicted phage tail protein
MPQNLAYDSATETISWDFVVNATSYELVYKAAADVDWTSAYTGTENAVVLELGVGDWEVKVRARNANGYSDFSGILSVVIEAVLGPPTGVAVTWVPASTERTRIAFTAPVGALSVDLYESNVAIGAPAGTYSLIGNYTLVSPIRRGGFPNMRTYAYLVAKNATQESENSAVAYCDNV